MAAGPVTQVGQNNTYIKDHESSGRMIIDFSRNTEDFSVNKYVQLRNVPKQTGFYLQLDQLQAGRIVGGNIDDYIWPDGHDRPDYNNEGVEFNWKDFQTVRRNIGHKLGNLAVDQASWNVENAQERAQCQKAMTLRTKMVHSALNASANWDSTHFQTVTAIAGGLWSAALSTTPFIKKSINYAVNLITEDTLGVVKKKDLRLVMGPRVATAISETQEIIDLIKQSPEAYNMINQGTSRWSEYGLPNTLYGIPIEVDETVIVTSPRNAANVTKSFVYGGNEVYLISRPGALVSKAGGPTFSTVTLFIHEEMTVERDSDQYHRRKRINVVDDIGVGMTAPAAGFAFRNVLS